MAKLDGHDEEILPQAALNCRLVLPSSVWINMKQPFSSLFRAQLYLESALIRILCKSTLDPQGALFGNFESFL